MNTDVVHLYMFLTDARQMWTHPRPCCRRPDSSALVLRTSETVLDFLHHLLLHVHTPKVIWATETYPHNFVLTAGGRQTGWARYNVIQGGEGGTEHCNVLHPNWSSPLWLWFFAAPVRLQTAALGRSRRTRAAGTPGKRRRPGRREDTIRSESLCLCWLARVVQEEPFSPRLCRTPHPWCGRLRTLSSAWHGLLRTPFSASPAGAVVDRRGGNSASTSSSCSFT